MSSAEFSTGSSPRSNKDPAFKKDAQVSIDILACEEMNISTRGDRLEKPGYGVAGMVNNACLWTPHPAMPKGGLRSLPRASCYGVMGAACPLHHASVSAA
jgi:hypothetical protein